MSGARAGYDPEARRETPLALKLKARIRKSGPILLADYMAACLSDPEHGYYRTRAAIGAAGDFVTAPEISQVFGELIGLWAAVVWQQMASPAQFNLVELGPGRGTLMADAIRASSIVPGFHAAARIVFVDVAPPVTASAPHMAREPLRVDSVADVPTDAAAIVIANEFLDTCPVQQLEFADRRCGMRAVGLDGDRLTFVSVAQPAINEEMLIAATPSLIDGGVIEAQDLSILHRLCQGRSAPWAGLLIDYGHFDPERGDEEVVGDTLQAVREHAYEHPLTSPGEADLTCHVDFNDVKLNLEIAGAGSLTVDGPTTQAEFLGRLGIVERAQRLMCANPARAGDIETGVARLIAPQAMGTRFKVLGVRSSQLPVLPGF